MTTQSTVRERFGARRVFDVGPGANLSGANLRSVSLSGANLSSANLTRAILNEANLAGARLDNANLSHAILFQTNLQSASAVGADFRGATLRDASLHGADLTGALIDVGECEQAFGDISTKLPDGRFCIMKEHSDDPTFGSAKTGGYRRLPVLLDPGAAPQPFIEHNCPAMRYLSDSDQVDLTASVVRMVHEVMNQQVPLTRDDWTEVDASWYQNRPSELSESGNPYLPTDLAQFIVMCLGFSFEEVCSDGSVIATLCPVDNVIEVLIQKILMVKYSEDIFDHGEVIFEVDITMTDSYQFEQKFGELIDGNGLSPNTLTKFWLRPNKRKLLLASISPPKDGLVRVAIEATQYGQEIAELIASEYGITQDVPSEIDVKNLGWSCEMKLEQDSKEEVDRVLLEGVHDSYELASLSKSAEIVGYETWVSGESTTYVAVVRVNEPNIGEPVVSRAALSHVEEIQAVIDDATFAFFFTTAHDGQDDSDDDSDDDSNDDSDDDSDDDSMRELQLLMGAMIDRGVGSGLQLAEYPFLLLQEGEEFDCDGDDSDDDHHVVDFIEDHFAKIVSAAQLGLLYIRSRPEVLQMLGISKIERLDSNSFRVQMKPTTAVRFNPNYEWIAPSKWVDVENLKGDVI